MPSTAEKIGCIAVVVNRFEQLPFLCCQIVHLFWLESWNEQSDNQIVFDADVAILRSLVRSRLQLHTES